MDYFSKFRAIYTSAFLQPIGVIHGLNSEFAGENRLFLAEETIHIFLGLVLTKTTHSELLFGIKLVLVQVWQFVTSPFLISYSSVFFGELGSNTALMPNKVREKILTQFYC